jgi:peptide/nickel transport system substrate-binding protein
MKVMRKLLLMALLLGIAIFAFAACNRGEDPVAPPQDGPVPIPTVTPTPPPAAPDLGTGGTDILVANPTPGRLLAHEDGTLFTRAEILAVTDMSAPAGELVIGNTTPLTGNWIGGFDSTATPVWLREIIHGGRGTMVPDFDGNWIPNPMVLREPTRITDNPDGSRTYTFFIYDDNQWSDGTHITAADFVFGILVYSSPQFRAIGGSVVTGSNLVGYQEFLNGPIISEEVDAEGNVTITRGDPTPYFAGVRLHGTDSFSVTVPHYRLPFVWEFLYQSWVPTPLHDWSNNGAAFTLEDTPQGARLSAGFTEEFLQARVNAPGGIRFNPTVVAGAYFLDSWDEGSGIAVLRRNPNFTAHWDGFHPQIYRLAFLGGIASAVQMDMLRMGEIDMIHALRAGNYINVGHDIVRELGQHSFISYARSGFGHLGWHCDHGVGQFTEVRRAVAWLLAETNLHSSSPAATALL